MTTLSTEHIQEQWRAAPGYPGYVVSSNGRVKRTSLFDEFGRQAYAEKEISQHLTGSLKLKQTRYWTVTLRTSVGMRETVKVHQLVLTAFCGPRPPGLVACHGKLGSLVNTPENLRWDTQANNIKDMFADLGGHPMSRKTRCKNGHDITNPDNIYANGVGRKCKRCQRWRATNQHRKNAGLPLLPVPDPD